MATALMLMGRRLGSVAICLDACRVITPLAGQGVGGQYRSEGHEQAHYGGDPTHHEVIAGVDQHTGQGTDRTG